MNRFLKVFIVAGTAWLSDVSVQSEPEMLNAIVARVNDAVITLRDVRLRMARDEEFLFRQYGRQPEVFEQMRRKLQQECIEELVESQLILHEFKTAGYKLPDSFIEEEIEKDIRTTYTDRATLTKTLQAQGRTYEAYRTEVRERFILAAMFQHNVTRDPVISPRKIGLYFVQNLDKFKVDDQVKLRLIVFTNSPSGSVVSSKKLAEEVLAKIREDGPPYRRAFAEMANIYSQGFQSGDGGERDWEERSVLRRELAEKAFALKAGGLSDVIETPDGFYLILVEGVRPTHIKSLSEVRDEIEVALKAEETKRQRKKWIDRLKDKSFVRFY